MGKRKHLIKELKKFIKNVGREFFIEKIFLFGSRAGKKFDDESDVDLIIVSPDFEGLDFFQRGAKMYDYWVLDLPVDFLCYTPEEFDKLKKKISIVSEAIKQGKEIII